MDPLNFETEIRKIHGWTIIHLPPDISSSLPSRGMCMAEVNISGFHAVLPLEPDGMGSHWFHISDSVISEFEIPSQSWIHVKLTPTKDWTEPTPPDDMHQSFTRCNVLAQWNSITTKARWEWIRWIRFTSNPETRKKRIETACSMLQDGKKRPCCFDQTRCTVPEVSKSGKLIIE